MYDRHPTIEAIRPLSRRSFELDLAAPQIAAACGPGQFVMVAVGGDVDPLLRRPMAVYRILRDETGITGLSILVERVGRGTRLLGESVVGETLAVLGPLGSGFRPALERPGEHLLVMGGIGSAPFPLLAEAFLAEGARVRAFIGGRTADDLVGADVIAALGVPVDAATEDGSEGARGFVTVPLGSYLESHGEDVAAVYSCGPTPMMRAVEDLVALRDLPHQVSLEAPMACGIGVCLSCVVRVRDRTGESVGARGWQYHRVCREGPVFDARSLLWDGLPSPAGGRERR